MLDIALLRRDLDGVIAKLEARTSPQPFLDRERFLALEGERKPGNQQRPVTSPSRRAAAGAQMAPHGIAAEGTAAGPRRSLAMLILTRRVGETVVIGNDVTVTVLGVKGNQVRLGVNAPREVAVHREEIYERIKREQADEDTRQPQAVGAVR